MSEWTKEELTDFDNSKTLQNRPFNDDHKTFEEDNPVWTVVVENRVFVRGAKGPKNSKWYVVGTKNSGEVEVNNKKYNVEYNAVTDTETIAAVSEAMRAKYPNDPSLKPMTSSLASSATVELVKR